MREAVIVSVARTPIGRAKKGSLKDTRPEAFASVIGGGPAGLAAAQQLARAGHQVKVFEKNAKIGGLLLPSQIPDLDASKLTSGSVPSDVLNNAWKLGGN